MVSRPSNMAPILLVVALLAHHGGNGALGFLRRLAQRLEAAAPFEIQRQAREPVEQVAAFTQRCVDAQPALLLQVLRQVVGAGDDCARHAAPVGGTAERHGLIRAVYHAQLRTGARVCGCRECHRACATCARPWAGSCSQAERISFSRRLTSSSDSGLFAELACMRRMHMYSYSASRLCESSPPALKLRLLRSSSMIATARCSSCAFSAPPLPWFIRPRAAAMRSSAPSIS